MLGLCSATYPLQILLTPPTAQNQKVPLWYAMLYCKCALLLEGDFSLLGRVLPCLYAFLLSCKRLSQVCCQCFGLKCVGFRVRDIGGRERIQHQSIRFLCTPIHGILHFLACKSATFTNISNRHTFMLTRVIPQALNPKPSLKGTSGPEMVTGFSRGSEIRRSSTPNWKLKSSQRKALGPETVTASFLICQLLETKP